MRSALHFQKLENKVRCTLCPHFCTLDPDEIGLCGVRQNREGELYSLVYGKAIASHVDPIEKKPLFHVYPGSRSMSIATAGCNFSCQFCQNHEISQVQPHRGRLIMGEDVTPDQVVRAAGDHGCKTIAFTYTEPTIYYEFAFDIARQAQDAGIESVWISNGFINPEPLKEIAPYLVGANIDLKGWDETFYKEYVGGRLKPVLQALKLFKESGVWVEVTTLVVPGHVDDENQYRDVSHFIRDELGPETPWHISRFYPHYQCTHLPSTPVDALRRAREIGQEEGLYYVYSGNVPGDDGEHTCCHHCGYQLIERYGFQVLHNAIRDGVCPNCGTAPHGVGM